MSVGQPQQMLLNMFGDLVQDLLGTSNVYHVGSSLGDDKEGWRDVDVRVLLEPEEWERLGLQEPDDHGTGHLDPKWRAYCIILSTYGRHFTGLPIDLQLQRLPEANARYSPREGHTRSYVGTISRRAED